jgi:nitroreductase
MNIMQRLRLSSEYVRLVKALSYDFRRYCKHACIGWNRAKYGEGQLEGRLIANYHVVEKGLSMPDFRPFFGVPTVKTLIRLIHEGGGRFGWCGNVNHAAACKVLHAYRERHVSMGLDLAAHFTESEIQAMSGSGTECQAVGGSADHQRESYFNDAAAPFAAFARSRHSCRNFDSSVPVVPERILAAIDTARHSPSVCNRQCWRVHIYQDRKKVSELLSLQEGNRGFGHTVPVILVITSSLTVFDGYKERNQAYIDGGLFSMSLMYALHSERLGCVPLCWLPSCERDVELRKAGGIPDDQTVMMFMGVGVPVDQFQAPVSQKRSVAEITTTH